MTPSGELTTLIQLMDQLRAPGGCPWVAIQTHESLSHYGIEEAHEVAEAAETHNLEQLREELGDLLLQVVFHARIAEEQPDGFDIADVVATLNNKLIRRNPHVFGSQESLSLAEVEAQWEAVKREEKPSRATTDGVPHTLPALVRAQKIYARTHPNGAGQETDARASAHEESTDSASIGQELWGVVAKAQRHGIDAEKALRQVTRAFETQI